MNGKEKDTYLSNNFNHVITAEPKILGATQQPAYPTMYNKHMAETDRVQKDPEAGNQTKKKCKPEYLWCRGWQPDHHQQNTCKVVTILE